MGYCEGWQQAITVAERLIDQRNFAHARHNLLAIKRFVAMFATPEAIAQLRAEDQRELRRLMRALAATWRRLAASAETAAEADADRLAG